MLLPREATHARDILLKESVDEAPGGKAGRQLSQQLLRDASKRPYNVVRIFALTRFRHRNQRHAENARLSGRKTAPATGGSMGPGQHELTSI